MNSCWKCGRECAGVECELCAAGIVLPSKTQIAAAEKAAAYMTSELYKNSNEIDWSKIKTVEDAIRILRCICGESRFLKNSPAWNMLKKFLKTSPDEPK